MFVFLKWNTHWMYLEAQYWTRTGRRDENKSWLSAIPEEEDGRRRYSKEDWAAILQSLEWVQEIAHNPREFPAGPTGITNSLEGG